MRRERLTVGEVLQSKGKRQFTEIKVWSVEEAQACAEAGVDMICTRGGELGRAVRAAAPGTFIIMSIPYGECANATEAVRAGFELLRIGADAVYACVSTEWIKAMSREGIPVVGHVGFVPQKMTWFGGYRAVGRAAAEALIVYRDTVAHQEAGAFAVEMEVVPHRIATEICRRVKDLAVISMGSGNGCDIQYLFACDILGSHKGHYPRHSKTYCDLAAEMDRLHKMSVTALHQYHEEVQTGAFPSTNNVVEIKDHEFEKFLNGLDPVRNG